MIISFNGKGLKELMIYLLIILLYRITSVISTLFEKNENSSLQMTMLIIYITERFVLPKEQNMNYKFNKSNIIKIILILSSNILFLNFFYLVNKIQYNDFLYADLIMIFLIDGFFFHKKIYSHQYLSIFINLIFFIYTYLYYYFYKYSKLISISYFILLIFKIIIQSYCYCFSYLLIKKINTKYFTSIFLLIGLFGFTKFLYGFKDIMQFFINGGLKGNIFQLIIYSFREIVYNFCICKILLKFNAVHFVTIDTLCYIIIALLNGFLNIEIFSSCIFIISSMIYLEIIKLHFFGFDKNLKDEIALRGDIEFNSILPSKLKNEF